VRIGTGFDAHAFAPGRPLILGGVEIPYDRGLAGHSDADVVTHAICDALLGAAALGDLGKHFPPSDPNLAGISSLTLLGHTRRLLDDAGYLILNLDATIIAQRPKLADFIPRMRAQIAEAAGVLPGEVSIKATTTDGLGFTGRGEGIAAQAVALIRPV
jgi:2-C-methyl-D-erythritol 2,4-cyclodiphosphate synthase